MRLTRAIPLVPSMMNACVKRSMCVTCQRFTVPPECNPKDQVLLDYVNRNPRNLEMLRLQQKSRGYELDARQNDYYYRVEFVNDGRHTLGRVRHHMGGVVILASTREWSIQSRMPSTTDHTAAVTVGRILARRCLQAGLTEIEPEKFEEAPSSAKMYAFLSALEEGGLNLGEPFRLHPRDFEPQNIVTPTKPWDVPEHEALRKEAINEDNSIEPGHRGSYDTNRS